MSARMLAVAGRCWRVAPLHAADIKIDLSKEQVGRPPATFEPIVGTWVVVQDGADKAIMVDGRPWVASKDTPTKLLVESARRLYGTNNEELMDNAKQFAYYPVAVLKSVDSFSNGTISLKFKTVGGDADRASGILFNVKPNGDWLAVRYNDTENNVALWEFHNGIRRNMRFSDRAHKFTPDRADWHELKLTVDGADLKTWLDGELALEYTLGSAARSRPRRRAAQSRFVSREQPGPAAARRRAGSGCGRRPTAPATSKTTWSVRSETQLKDVSVENDRLRNPARSRAHFRSAGVRADAQHGHASRQRGRPERRQRARRNSHGGQSREWQRARRRVRPRRVGDARRRCRSMAPTTSRCRRPGLPLRTSTRSRFAPARRRACA